ncbi:ribosomal protein L7/L12 [Kitasatospora cineracea]|uniref:Ribosomal L7/L12-like protein n=1 Tax=Kitasatospora cineracea TaxID=88074 RepID=A0A8G1UFN8_9ACTN|nr:ribosomal protein L7/L12 [Kitasatospora cineracea]ROR37401.1 ribosomal L7/L12-like protein [Kitasatospora cineracea]
MAVEYALLICDQGPISVVLTDPGPRPFEVVKVVRRRTGLSLWHSKSLISDLPATILEDAAQEVAEATVRELLEAGAHAEVRE